MVEIGLARKGQESMQRHPVASTSISSIGYDFDSSTLEVEFQNGGVYLYYGVSESVYRALMSSSSKGSYVADRIKDRFAFLRVE